MEKEGSNKKRAIPNDSRLIELLFSWSLEDISNNDLYRNQIMELVLCLIMILQLNPLRLSLGGL
ncbi:hypothetical protein CK203_015912 [Vitis vinifera]|uniref:Uncharacterized protein n=1 Tax=Vitis vinifera TaxID=29760 RepID=A0A438JRX0_VITVI|nr:hypothetical protein CK203_015912 [Vitis vinifera]